MLMGAQPPGTDQAPGPGLHATAMTVSSEGNYNSSIYENMSILTSIHTPEIHCYLTYSTNYITA